KPHHPLRRRALWASCVEAFLFLSYKSNHSNKYIHSHPLMANSFIARFANEVAPPQYISVMRHKAPKILDTISEEDNRNVTNYVSAKHQFSCSFFFFGSKEFFTAASAAVIVYICFGCLY
ncbi:hypothetical protein PanWU01x14_283900, partial [Parasponia andersonii]